MMKTGFSSLVCPAWDLETIVTSASSMGFDGVELRGLRGELHLPQAPELAGDPEAARRLFRENGVDLVCLASSATLVSRQPKEVARQKAVVAEWIELAAALACPYVRMFLGEVPRFDHRRAALSRIVTALRALVPVAARNGVTLLVENGGDFVGSEDLWFVIDGVDHPNLQCCWNQCHALSLGERPTNSIPRLGGKIGTVHLCDADFDEQGVLEEYRPVGEGGAEVARQIELLRGMAFDGYLLFEWPKLWVDSLPAPEAILPAVGAFLRERLAAEQPVLSAYKADKNKPKLASRS